MTVYIHYLLGFDKCSMLHSFSWLDPTYYVLYTSDNYKNMSDDGYTSIKIVATSPLGIKNYMFLGIKVYVHIHYEL